MWFLALLLAVAVVGEPTSDDEYDLRSALAKRVDSVRKHMRPVVGSMNQSVPLQHGLSLIHIVSFSEDTREFTGHFFTKMSWRDMQMTWKPEEHNGITSLRIQTDNLWNPDVVLYNGVDFDRKENIDVMKVLYSDGNILYIPNSHYTVKCTPGGDNDADWTCPLKFGSWVYDAQMLDLQFYEQMEEVDLSDLVPDPVWEVVGAPAVRNEKQYPCCPESYTDILYSIFLKRREGRSTRSLASETAGRSAGPVLVSVGVLLATLKAIFC